MQGELNNAAQAAGNPVSQKSRTDKQFARPTDEQVIEEFADAMFNQDVRVNPAELIADGKLHRIHADGDGKNVKDCWYILHVDERPAGKFGHNGKYGHDVSFSWSMKVDRAPMSAEEKRARLDKQARDKAAKAEAKRVSARRAARKAIDILSGAKPYVAAEHAVLNGYLARKGIVDACGALIGDFPVYDPRSKTSTVIQNALLIPMRDIDGNVWSVQAIFPNADNVLERDRTYLAGGDKLGKFFVIGAPKQVDGADVLVVCEGFATGVAIHRATGHAVRVAFDAGSLEPVATVLRDANRDSILVIAGDNDRWKDPARNPGLNAAFAAAAAVGGMPVWPPFMADVGEVDAAGKLRGPTDFDDMVRADGDAELRRIFGAVLEQVVSFRREARADIEAANRAALPEFGPNDLPAADLPSVSLLKHFYALAAFSKRPDKESTVTKIATKLERELRQARGFEPSEPGDEGMHHSAASYAWTLVKRRVRYTPAEMDVDGLIGRIRCAGAPIHENTLTRMGGWMNWMCSHRQSTARLRVGISEGAKLRHDYMPCVELPTLTEADYRGVILVRAPMGSGKTKKIGLAFSQFAQYSNSVGGDARFVAIVHRVTLVSALVKVLGLTHYRDGRHPITKENAVEVTALGVCVPSINRASLRVIMENCKYLLIDEIAQVLTFLESRICFEEEGESSRQAVYAALQSLVRNATCVIGMDAGVNDRVVKFIEQCRPAGERIRIYDMAQGDEKLSAKYGFGAKAVDMFYEEANRRLNAGEKPWIGCDSRKQATELHEVLSDLHPEKRFLLITRDTTDRNEQRAFLADANKVSREYDCVIHSPSISSGLSIEHREPVFDENGEQVFDENGEPVLVLVPHFDHCMFLGGGCSISAADALQMMRRVRYVKTWTVAIHQNNTESGPTDPRDIIAAKEKGVAAERKIEQAGPMAWYFAEIEADRNDAKIEFANELFWLMEDALFSIERTHQAEDRFDPATRKNARLTIEMREKSMIIAARDLSDEEAERLERSANKSDEDHAALTRHEIARLFGDDVFSIAAADVLDAPLWDAYKDGRGLRRIDNFSGAVHGVADTSEGARPFEDMGFDVARRQFQALLWGDTVLKPGVTIEMSAAAGIVDRALANRVTFAYHGVIPKRWAVGKSYKPKLNPLVEVIDMLKLMGLETFEVPSDENPSISALQIEEESFRFMEEWSGRRRAMQTGAQYVAPAAPAPLPTLAERIQALQAQGGADILATMIVFGALFGRLNATLPTAEQVTRKALAETLEGMGMHLFSKALKLKRGGKWIQSTVYVDADLTGVSNEAVRDALDASAGLGGDCDLGAVLFKRTMPVLESPPKGQTQAQQGGKAKKAALAKVDAETAENEAVHDEYPALPEAGDELDLSALAME